MNICDGAVRVYVEKTGIIAPQGMERKEREDAFSIFEFLKVIKSVTF